MQKIQNLPGGKKLDFRWGLLCLKAKNMKLPLFLSDLEGLAASPERVRPNRKSKIKIQKFPMGCEAGLHRGSATLIQKS